MPNSTESLTYTVGSLVRAHEREWLVSLSKPQGKSITPTLALVVVFLLVFASLALAHQFRTVKRVVDGDTLVLENGERVRLIGVDTPETKDPRRPVEHYGKEAAEFTKKMVEGKRIRLEFDPANAHTGHKDNTRQRRTLAYVYLEDGTLLNAEIIKQGYGHAYTRFPFKYIEEFRQVERKARENRKGLWAEK